MIKLGYNQHYKIKLKISKETEVKYNLWWSIFLSYNQS